jgi:hypothetical protein
MAAEKRSDKDRMAALSTLTVFQPIGWRRQHRGTMER